MPFEDELSLMLKHACRVSFENVCLIHAHCNGVKVEEDGLELALPVDATPADALLTLGAVFVTVAPPCFSWRTCARGAVLTVGTMGVILALASATPSYGATVAPTFSVRAIEVRFTALRFALTGVGLAGHTWVDQVTLAVIATITADSIDTDLVP